LVKNDVEKLQPVSAWMHLVMYVILVWLVVDREFANPVMYF